MNQKMSSAVFAIMLASPLFATVYYVVPSGTKGNAPASPYDSWATAANNIKTAIDASSADDSVYVAPGIYAVDETLNVSKRLTIKSVNVHTGNEDRENTILDGGGATAIMAASARDVKISGFTFANAYAASETSAMNNPSTGGAALFISGNNVAVSNCIFRGNSSSNVVGTCIFTKGTQTTISDSVFTNNTQIGSGYVAGTAIYTLVGSGASTEDLYCKIAGCTFQDNRATGTHANGSLLHARYGRTVIDGGSILTNTFTHLPSGGAAANIGGGIVYVGGGAASAIRNCHISCNAIDSSEYHTYGSLMTLAGDCTISNCTFTAIKDDKTTKASGTIRITGDNVNFIGCRFLRNSVTTGLGFIYVYKTSGPLFRNCLFAKNTRSGGNCSMIRQDTCTGATGLMVENCTFADNSDSISAGLLGFTEISTCKNYLENSVFTASVAAGTTTVARNCCMVSLLGGAEDSGNFTIESAGGASRLFANSANGDYTLTRRSPLRDKGVLLSWMTPGATDIDGSGRVVSGEPDIGCCECQIHVPGFSVHVR